ncbi:hypothetical protein ACJD0Z_04160 [Flavobacteriaceae bacterium M23B6Z8]
MNKLQAYCLIFLPLFFSCKNELPESRTDSRTIFDFQVLPSEKCDDSCGNKLCYSYSMNDSLKMAGSGDRLIKQCKWFFHNTNGSFETIFESGLPQKTIYSKNNIIKWKQHRDSLYGYHLSYPANWFSVNITDDITFNVIKDSLNLMAGEANLVISNYDDDLGDAYEKELVEYNRRFNIQESKVKRLNVEGMDEVVQRILKIKLNDKKIIVFQTAFANNDRVFHLTFRSEEKFFNENYFIFDHILWSIRFIK